MLVIRLLFSAASLESELKELSSEFSKVKKNVYIPRKIPIIQLIIEAARSQTNASRPSESLKNVVLDISYYIITFVPSPVSSASSM